MIQTIHAAVLSCTCDKCNQTVQDTGVPTAWTTVTWERNNPATGQILLCKACSIALGQFFGLGALA